MSPCASCSGGTALLPPIKSSPSMSMLQASSVAKACQLQVHGVKLVHEARVVGRQRCDNTLRLWVAQQFDVAGQAAAAEPASGILQGEQALVIPVVEDGTAANARDAAYLQATRGIPDAIVMRLMETYYNCITCISAQYAAKLTAQRRQPSTIDECVSSCALCGLQSALPSHVC